MIKFSHRTINYGVRLGEIQRPFSKKNKVTDWEREKGYNIVISKNQAQNLADN